MTAYTLNNQRSWGRMLRNDIASGFRDAFRGFKSGMDNGGVTGMSKGEIERSLRGSAGAIPEAARAMATVPGQFATVGPELKREFASAFPGATDRIFGGETADAWRNPAHTTPTNPRPVPRVLGPENSDAARARDAEIMAARGGMLGGFWPAAPDFQATPPEGLDAPIVSPYEADPSKLGAPSAFATEDGAAEQFRNAASARARAARGMASVNDVAQRALLARNQRAGGALPATAAPAPAPGEPRGGALPTAATRGARPGTPISAPERPASSLTPEQRALYDSEFNRAHEAATYPRGIRQQTEEDIAEARNQYEMNRANRIADAYQGQREGSSFGIEVMGARPASDFANERGSGGGLDFLAGRRAGERIYRDAQQRQLDRWKGGPIQTQRDRDNQAMLALEQTRQRGGMGLAQMNNDARMRLEAARRGGELAAQQARFEEAARARADAAKQARWTQEFAAKQAQLNRDHQDRLRQDEYDQRTGQQIWNASTAAEQADPEHVWAAPEGSAPIPGFDFDPYYGWMRNGQAVPEKVAEKLNFDSSARTAITTALGLSYGAQNMLGGKFNSRLAKDFFSDDNTVVISKGENGVADPNSIQSLPKAEAQRLMKQNPNLVPLKSHSRDTYNRLKSFTASLAAGYPNQTPNATR